MKLKGNKFLLSASMNGAAFLEVVAVGLDQGWWWIIRLNPRDRCIRSWLHLKQQLVFWLFVLLFIQWIIFFGFK